eukprot:gnl/TRDRNA2_/TRDRNA2_120895_c1_seq1.p1 gnl/TRDRNA2_/TRDRNA2_120895_c1~~gnl/TRDRNA2_/TRDRNA2_120895_c1_seq1.p1  ORF type:complete len:917 (-),score=213.11 gnl/TRDRNA2_/TRDRNA2_120895_c1_seq1:158-2908(-)
MFKAPPRRPPPPQWHGPPWQRPQTVSPTASIDYKVAHGKSIKSPGAINPPTFVLVKNAGTGEADGIYKPGDRKWEDCDVYSNWFGDCIISRESHVNPKTQEKKYGWVLGRDGRLLYGQKSERLHPTEGKGWKCFQGEEPIPEIATFKTWSECCQHGAWYFSEEANNAAKGCHWKVVLMMADRAFECHTNARPKGKGDARQGGTEWSEQLCELLATRADALIHLGEFKRALVDACSAVHFIYPFDWSRAKTRGVTACLNLGVEESQAKLLIEWFSRRTDREFPGVRQLEPLVDEMLGSARRGELKAVALEDENKKKIQQDGRLYFRVVDPEDLKLYKSPEWTAKVVGSRKYNDIIRGEELIKNGTWLELHVAEDFDNTSGITRCFAPMFTDEEDEDLRDDVLEACGWEDYPRRPKWEVMKLSVKPLGIKPPTDAECTVDYSLWRDHPKLEGQKIWPYVYKHVLAVGCMLRGAPLGAIETWIRYHWAIGFNHLFLYFDDPKDPGIEIAKFYENQCTTNPVEGLGITWFQMDETWWLAYRTTSRFYQRRDKSDYYESVCKLQDEGKDVEVRQMMAMDQAIVVAHQMGVDWFAHIGIDECMYVPQNQDNSARRFICSKPRSVNAIQLWNHEAIPESLESEDWFRECSLFQTNPSLLRGFKPPAAYDELIRKKEGREFEPPKENPDFKYWDRIVAKVHMRRQTLANTLKLNVPPAPPGTLPCMDGVELLPALQGKDLLETFCGFGSYKCGRSIVRLDPHVKPPIPYNAYIFVTDSGEMLKEYYQGNDGIQDAVILHYPNVGFEYWRQKHQRGSEIPVSKGANGQRMELASSQVVRTKPHRLQEQFYKTFIMQNEHSELAYLAEYGLVQRIEGVQELIDLLDNPPVEEEVLPGRVKRYDPKTGMQFAGSGNDHRRPLDDHVV